MKIGNYLAGIFILLFVFILTSSATHKIIYPKGFVYIPSGTMERKVVSALWMSETEVTNEDYQLFLKDLLDSGKLEIYRKAYPDTIKLKSLYWIGAYKINYFTHPYFKECPVVCVSPLQIGLYCEWLTKRYLKHYPSISPEGFRLPTINEWEYAARGGRVGQYFPWGGPFLRNNCNYPLSCPRANYMVVDEKTIFLDTQSSAYISIPWENYYWDITERRMKETDSLIKTLYLVKKHKYAFFGMPQRANEYFPNDYGLYNMVGNVAEIVVDNNGKMRCVGGSYKTPGAYLRLDLLLDHHAKDSFPMEDVGFRVVANYIHAKK